MTACYPTDLLPPLPDMSDMPEPASPKPLFFPLYARPALSPAVAIGWLCALAMFITVYTWLVVQINDMYYQGVMNSRCHIIYTRVNNVGYMDGFYLKEVGRHLEVLTDERDGIHNWREVQADCNE